MNPDYQEKILQSRAAGFSDEDIFNKMKTTPDFQEKYQASEQMGVSSKETDKYIKEKYGLTTKEPKTFLQNVYSALSYNPVAHAIEGVAGRNPISENLREAQQGLVTGGPAAILSAPHEIARFPEKMLEAMREYHGGENPGVFESGNVGLRSLVEPVLKGADWLSEKTGLKGATENLYSFEDALELMQGEKKTQTHVGKFTERVSAGLGTGGPLGAIIGGADYLAEQAGLSPEQRGIMALMIGKAQKGKGAIKTIKPSEIIDSTHDLAARAFAYNPDDINMQTMKAAYDLNIPIEDIPMQAIYKNGLPNLVEGISQNSVLGAGKFDKLLGNFTDNMTSKVQGVIDSMPIDTGLETLSTTSQLGEPTFTNVLPEVFENAAPALNVPKHQTGRIGKNALQAYNDDITAQYETLYNDVKFNNNDLLRPSSSQYDALQKTIKTVNKKLSSKGFKGGERKEALGVLSDINQLFKLKETEHPITGEVLKEKPNIKLEDIRKNIQDLNKTISYEHPSLVNLLEPVSRHMRSILDVAAEGKPHLESLPKANALFREKAQFFNQPLMKKMVDMTDEQFYRAVRNNPSMLHEFSEFARATGQEASLNNLKGQIIADVLEKPLKATTPKEFVSSISDKVIKEMRELEPFYPELQGMSQQLENMKRQAATVLSPEERFRSKIRQQILEDVMSDSEFTNTLNIMNSPKGIRLVQGTLRNTPQGRSLLKTLEHKKVEQALYNGPKKQEINLSELGEVFDNPKTDSILRTLLSDQNYRQAKSVSDLAKQYQKGTEAHGKLKSKFESGIGLGLIPAMYTAPVKTTFGIGSVAYYLTSKNFKKALFDNAKKQYDLKLQTNKKQAQTNHNKAKHISP